MAHQKFSPRRNEGQTLAGLGALATLEGEFSRRIDRNSSLQVHAAVAPKVANPPKRERAYVQQLAALRASCPLLVEDDCWQQAIKDVEQFCAQWGDQAVLLGWTARDLFGLQSIPEKPAPNYRRLSRYDMTGLIWLLRGRPVMALTEATAAIQGACGAITVYRKDNKPALGPVGDNLCDLDPRGRDD